MSLVIIPYPKRRWDISLACQTHEYVIKTQMGCDSFLMMQFSIWTTQDSDMRIIFTRQRTADIILEIT